MGIIVQKYGGSSVSDVSKIKFIAERVIARKKKGDSMVVVLSAMGRSTNKLIDLAKGISENPDKRELDQILSTGEIVSISLLAMAIKDMGYDAISYTGAQVGIKTTDLYGEALIKSIDSKKIIQNLDQGKIVIIAGFQGVNSKGDVTTLGRGGSDTTAVALTCALGGICEIYTDVSGIYSLDPRKFIGAKKLEYINYEEMMELSSLGAKVMHTRSVELGKKYNIPIYVGMSTEENGGTFIMDNNMEKKIVTGIVTDSDDISINLTNVDSNINMISKLFNSIAQNRINVDMISQTAPISSRINISFTIPKEEKNLCLDTIREYVNDNQIQVDSDICKFSVVGLGMKTSYGVAARVFEIFSNNNIEVKMITTSEIRITCAIREKDEELAAELVAREFGLIG